MIFEKLDTLTFFQLRVVEQFAEMFEKINAREEPDLDCGYLGDKLRAIPEDFISPRDMLGFARYIDHAGDLSWHVVCTDLGVGLVTRFGNTWMMELLPVISWPDAFITARKSNRWRWLTTDSHEPSFVDFIKSQVLACMQVNTYNYNSSVLYETNLTRHTNVPFDYTVLSDETGYEFDDIINWLASNPDEHFYHDIMQYRICGSHAPVSVCRINNVVVVNSVPAEHRQWAITWAKLQGIYNDETDELFIRRCFRLVKSTIS